jgi:uncharacterized protein (TIGR03435 family)
MVRSFFLLALAAAASGQQTSSLPSFEVVSIKPSTPQSGARSRGISTFPGGRVRASMCPLYYLITEAFHIQKSQLVGGPRWIQEEEFDMDAVPPANSNASKSMPKISKLPPNDEQRLMMQSMLADRFHLRYHREMRETSVYLLVRTGKELKLTAAANPDEFPWVGSVGGGAITRDGLRATNATMALMAERLTDRLDRMVIDKTGLEGAYDFRYEYRADDKPDLITAILASVQGLGLKLEPSKAPVETIVIDSVERPAGN